MLRSLTSFAKALPFCCGLLFIAAAEDDCTLRILGEEEEEEEEEECEDAESVCNLECELAVNDEGCPICECAEQPLPENCIDDSDCAEGQFCAFTGYCPPCEEEECESDCASAAGSCVDIDPVSCAAVLCAPDTICVEENGQAQCIPVDTDYCGTDDDCGGGGLFCDFSQCGGTAAPPQDGSDEGGSDEDARCAGVCREIPQLGCANVLCEENTTCIEGVDGPTCIPNVSECSQDEECGPSAHCEITCLSDPNCPYCDVCMVVGQCVLDNACEALCGVGSFCAIDVVDGSLSCLPTPVAECTSDSDCETGVCNAADICLSDPACGDSNDGLVACTEVCWGFCVEPQPTSCSADADCAEGEQCLLLDGCAECEPGAPCPPCVAVGQCI